MPKRRFQQLATSQKTSILSTSQNPPSPPAEPDIYDAIAYECIEVQSDEDVDAVAKETLRKAVESAEPGAAGERMTYGNQAGLRLLEDKHEIMERMKRLEDQVANNKDQIADHQGQIAYFHDRIRTLTTDAEGYYSIRHRFIDVYRRDVLHDVTEPGRTKIKEGNAAAPTTRRACSKKSLRTICQSNLVPYPRQ